MIAGHKPTRRMKRNGNVHGDYCSPCAISATCASDSPDVIGLLTDLWTCEAGLFGTKEYDTHHNQSILNPEFR